MLEEINSRFNSELKKLTRENVNNTIFNLGNPSETLLSAGIENKPIKLYGNKLPLKSEKHEYSPSDLKDLPRAIAAPIAIFNDKQHGGHTILTEIIIAGDNALVALGVGKHNDREYNTIKTIFPKNAQKIREWFNSNITLYSNKEKVREYLLRHPSLIREPQAITDFTW